MFGRGRSPDAIRRSALDVAARKLEAGCQPCAEAYFRLARQTGLGALVERIESGYLEQSPSGGYHRPYRCARIAGNTKLAKHPKRPDETRDPADKLKTLIETRGQGGYIIVAPTSARVDHRSPRFQQGAGGLLMPSRACYTGRPCTPVLPT